MNTSVYVASRQRSPGLALVCWRAGYAEGQEFFSQMLSVFHFVSVFFMIRCFHRMVQWKYNTLCLARQPMCPRSAEKNPSPLEVEGMFLTVVDIATGRLFSDAAALHQTWDGG